MDIRIFQIIVPMILIGYMIYEVKNVLNSKKSWVDLIPSIILSFSIMTLAILPDWTTKKVAFLLGFKNNINAILFALIGLLSLFILRIFDVIRELRKDITKLSIKYALLKEQMESEE